jgi:hypothetical protein
MDSSSGIAGALHFFLYDSIKILTLLFVMISAVGFLRSYISQSKMRSWLAEKGVLGNIFAALFGSVTPFCSCSSIPVFLGLIEAGIPLGVTFSFLITSPLINEYLAVLMLGFFGVKITVIYILSGLLIGIVAGVVLGKLRLERYLIKDVAPRKEECQCQRFKSKKDRLLFGVNEAKSIVKKLWIWVLLGVGVGALIHNYVPQESIQNIINKTGPLSVPIAVILGVPMYGNCAAIVPIAVVLFRKGIPLGTALAFMMATAALSFPEMMILKRAMKWRLIAAFFGITTLGIIITGYLFNLVQTLGL